MNVRTLDELSEELSRAIATAGKRDPSLKVYATLAQHAGVKTTTLQSWFLGTHEPRALKLAAVAERLGVSMDRLVYTGSRKAFCRIGIDQMVDGLDDGQRADLTAAMRSILETAALLERPTDVIAAFRKQIETCAEMCRRLH